MKELWDGSSKLDHIKNMDTADYYARKPPPAVKLMRKQRKLEERTAAEKLARDKAKAERGQGRGGGRGRSRGGGRGDGRGDPPQRDPPQRDPPQRDQPQRDPPLRDQLPCDQSPRRSPRQHQPQPSPSPPGSVKAVKKQLRMLKAAQAFDGTAQRAGEIEGLQTDLEERERKYRKYGRW